MNLHLSLKTKVCMAFMALLLGPLSVYADEEEAEPAHDPNALVEVQIDQDFLADYKERRDHHGFYFGIQYEPVQLSKYTSQINSTSYSSMFGSEPVPLIRANIDYKYNMALGSIAIGGDIARGEITGNLSGTETTLAVTKYGVNLQFTVDNIWPEPYVAPYVGVNVWQMMLDEKTDSDSKSMTTQIGYNYMFGLLCQLDWIDKDTDKNSNITLGLENTFLDVYVTQYAKTQSKEDPDTSTDLGYGAGIRLEF